jgi:hypothetical protein
MQLKDQMWYVLSRLEWYSVRAIAVCSEKFGDQDTWHLLCPKKYDSFCSA